MTFGQLIKIFLIYFVSCALQSGEGDCEVSLYSTEHHNGASEKCWVWGVLTKGQGTFDFKIISSKLSFYASSEGQCLEWELNLKSQFLLLDGRWEGVQNRSIYSMLTLNLAFMHIIFICSLCIQKLGVIKEAILENIQPSSSWRRFHA